MEGKAKERSRKEKDGEMKEKESSVSLHILPLLFAPITSS